MDTYLHTSWRLAAQCIFMFAIGMAIICFGLSSPVQAQTTKIYQLVVTITENADPVASKGSLVYTFNVKNQRIASGSIRTANAILVAAIPAGATFVQCTTSIDTRSVKRCTQSGGVITASFGYMGANVTRRVTLTLKAPNIPTHSSVEITGTATGDNAFKGEATARTGVLADNTTVTLLPSLQQKAVQCGDTLGSTFFGSNTTARFDAGLGCVDSAFGLRIGTSNVTFDLNKRKIVGEPKVGNTGILIGAGATNVTINGQGTDGSNGIEFFDWCLQDEGGNTGLVVTNLRCFRARSAALDLASDNVLVEDVKLDNTAFISNVTTELPGGIGIRGRGDNVRIKDAIVRRSRVIGIWLDGLDTDGNGHAGTVHGNLSTSQVQDSNGVGIFLQHGPHQVKDSTVSGDGFEDGTSSDGIVVDTTSTNALLENLVIKEHRGNAIVVNGDRARLETCKAENIGGAAVVIAGANALVGNGKATATGDGFVIIGPDATLDTNSAERTRGVGFLITGPRAMLSGNEATENISHGFVLGGEAAQLDTNGSERNKGRGMRITGTGNLVESTEVSGNRGIGVEVLGQNNKFRTNGVERSSAAEWSIGVNNIDLGGNSANGRSFTFGAAGGTFE